MSNGDQSPNQRNFPDCDSKSDSMDGTVEFKILMAYAQRRRTAQPDESPTPDSPAAPNGCTDTNTRTPSQVPAKPEREETNKGKAKKNKTKQWKRLLHIFKCIKPETKEEDLQEPPTSLDEVNDRIADGKDDKTKVDPQLEEVVSRLTELADDISFTPPDIESDAPEDDENVERLIGLLLREAGDRLNEQELKDVCLSSEIFWNYNFFKRLIRALLTRMGLRSPNPDSPGPQASPKTQIAVACEATSRLSAMDTLPMNRLLGYGARYLNEEYSSWAQQQGGYEAAFEEDEDDVQ
ncbi:apoptosis facilitator Bcl-2-like protein 14 [Mastacembelus armatus]|uniref:Apoptosis facilitator Bcl-2-like protein 14 n=1 Tax=Mastacembelus armatus TaxID=205130 RepID=A0A3Q3MTR4_9TELE|nr:apoptosis facilitator Bcl-2-like protein 14 [Mastacembelus armatus]XP_026182701.1 apoptosis facilitator Bcl-2-like protein 14 [Mastacembelus armatus]XP_026182702.1 apoptosis facilitator Bcl-2-like protein 14 [Mastacembelus armatus]XP_026182703.1 apoptosis facilitator Bcl-2-like protein 14 [Mastacembelus armatus]